jgi:hypothetical protein
MQAVAAVEFRAVREEQVEAGLLAIRAGMELPTRAAVAVAEQDQLQGPQLAATAAPV